MTICYFGIYHPAHPRNVVFLGCLRRAGFQVVEINCQSPGLTKYLKLGWRLFRARKNIDLIMVGFPGQQAVILAKLFCPRKPLIFNALLSLHDAVIQDRQRYRFWSWRASYFWLLDYLSFRLANCTIMDCQEYAKYLKEKFRVPDRKLSVIFLGASEDVIKPLSVPEEKLSIHYYSSFIPTHGTDIIIQAAQLLNSDGVSVVFCGRGQCYERDRKYVQANNITNVKFVDRFPRLEQLNEFINSSWVCLGLFSDTARVHRSIGSKVFEALCAGRPVITGRTRATMELLQDGRDALLVKLNDPEDLVAKIRSLIENEELRLTLARNGRAAFERSAAWVVIGRQLSELINLFYN